MQGWELFVVVGIVVLLFGASRLPKIARSLGEARTELEKVRRESEADEPPLTPAPQAETMPGTKAEIEPAAEVDVPRAAPSLVVESVVVAEPSRQPLPPPLPPPGS